ncbi:MAG TPA: serine/threonine-protein kinase [Candidatus Sulfotelmatobacter sp.]|nr:serine/threonine-protein kinase [Candidatus Sulfotelmatobacter sp.]
MAMKKDFGAFELHEKIGSGGMASVYRGVQKSLDRRVVLKVLYPHLAEDEKLVQRFEREARAAAMLRHENIVQVIDCGRYEDVSYIAMEFVDGMDLKKWMEAHGPPPIEMALLLLRDLCAGLEHAHQHRIVHRDIKPANIMLTPDGTLKIMDFGLARRGEDSTAVTVVGSVLGTPAYMSPEQATGEAVDERSDIFSAGVVGYELLGAQRPFSGDSYSTVLRAVLTVEPPRLEEVNPLVPPEVVAIIHRMLQKDVSKRYPKISQVRGELETVIDQLGMHRGRDLLREYAQEPERVAETLKKKRLSRHMDQGLYFENMGRGKIDDAIMEYRRVVYLDPENRQARDKLKKLEAERRTLQTQPEGPPVADPGVTMVMPPEAIPASTSGRGAAPPEKPPGARPSPARPSPARPAPRPQADKAAATRNLLIGAVGVLLVLIAVVVFVIVRGGGEKTAANNAPATPTTPAAPPPGGHASESAPVTPAPPPAVVSTPATPSAAAATGSLEVTTDPPQARISINGKLQSKRSNATLADIPAGTASVKVEKDGYLTQAQSVDVPVAGVGHISFKLDPNPNLPGTLEIKVTPFATYFIDDQQVAANVASTRQQLKPGVYTVRAVHPAFDPKEWKNIRIEPGKTLTLSFDFLASSQVTVRVTSDPWGEVVVDGQKTGKFTPCELQLASGTRTITVVRDGFVAAEGSKSVTLKAGPPVSVSFTLKKK